MRLFQKGEATPAIYLVLGSAMLPPVKLVGWWIIIPQFAMLLGGIAWAIWALYEPDNTPAPRDTGLWFKPRTNDEWRRGMGYDRSDLP